MLEELEQLRVVTEAAPSLLAFVDQNLRYQFVNQTYERWFGKPRAQILGKTMREVLSDRTFASIEPYARAALAGEQVTYTNTIHHANGVLRHTQATYVPRRDASGLVSGFVALVHDITEQMQTRLRLATGSARCILWYADISEIGKPWLHWEMQLYDEAAAQHFFPLDIQPPERPYPLAWHLSRLPEDRERMEEFGRAQVRANQSYSQEFRCRGLDGQIRWFKEDVEVTPLAPGKWRAVGVTTDITDLRQAEEALREKERLLRVFMRDVLFSVSEGKLRLCDGAADLPQRLGSCAPAIGLTSETLSVLRGQVQDLAAQSGFSRERIADLISAVGEAGMNAVVHAGGGTGTVYFQSLEDSQTVQVWIEDTGGGIAVDALHRATLEPGYTTAGTLGYGFWIILRTADRVWLLTRPEGTVVVLEQDRVLPAGQWLFDRVSK